MRQVDLVGRVRTRVPEEDFHHLALYWDILQEVDYFEGAVWAESHRMGDPFQRFSDAIREATQAALQAAWRDPPVSASQATRDPQPPPESYGVVRSTYLLDVRQNSAAALWNRAGMERRFQRRIRQDEKEPREAWLDGRGIAAHDAAERDFKQWMDEDARRLIPLSRREALRNGAKSTLRRSIDNRQSPQNSGVAADGDLTPAPGQPSVSSSAYTPGTRGRGGRLGPSGQSGCFASNPITPSG